MKEKMKERSTQEQIEWMNEQLNTLHEIKTGNYRALLPHEILMMRFAIQMFKLSNRAYKDDAGYPYKMYKNLLNEYKAVFHY